MGLGRNVNIMHQLQPSTLTDSLFVVFSANIVPRNIILLVGMGDNDILNDRLSTIIITIIMVILNNVWTPINCYLLSSRLF